MLPIPSFLAPASVGVRVLNALLAREDWARERLTRHAGKTVRFVFGRFVTSLAISASGRVSVADPAIVPDVTLTVPPARLPKLPSALGSNDPERIAGLLTIQGDAALANVVAGLARDLRWDVENDLSPWVGDIAAHRLVAVCHRLAGDLRQSAQRAGANLTEYLTEESATLLGRGAYRDWVRGVAAADARLDGLEARVGKLAPFGTDSQPMGGR